MQNLIEEVREFINRKFPIDCNWCNGNCFWFAKILDIRFDLDIYYLPVMNHFVAGNGDVFFDWEKTYTKEDFNEPIYLWYDEYYIYPQEVERICNDCIK